MCILGYQLKALVTRMLMHKVQVISGFKGLGAERAVQVGQICVISSSLCSNVEVTFNPQP